MKINRTFALYAFSTLAVVAAFALLNTFGVSHSVLSVYVPLAFFSVAGLDFYRTQVLEDGRSEVAAYRGNSSSFADRFLGYLFVAPFIFPARVYQQVVSR